MPRASLARAAKPSVSAAASSGNSPDSDFNLQLRQSDGQAFGEVIDLYVTNDGDNGNVVLRRRELLRRRRDRSRTRASTASPPVHHGGGFTVGLTVHEDAPEACIGVDVWYAVLITVETLGGDPGDVS